MLALEGLTTFLRHPQRYQIFRSENLIDIPFVGVPSTRNIHRKYFVPQRLQSIDKLSVWLPNLSGERKTKDGIDDQTLPFQVLLEK